MMLEERPTDRQGNGGAPRLSRAVSQVKHLNFPQVSEIPMARSAIKRSPSSGATSRKSKKALDK